MWNWILHEIGVRPVSGSGTYAFWSGFGSDLGEATLVVAIIGGYRHHSCHIQGCVRLAKHDFEMAGAKYRLCPKHHPAVSDAPLTHEAVLSHHQSATKRSRRAPTE